MGTRHLWSAGGYSHSCWRLGPGVVGEHDIPYRRFIETIATRFWWIDAGRLLEIHDPSRYFDSLKEASPDSIGGSGGGDRLPGNTDNSTFADEDALLERVCELERLLAADKARKLKFQKPRRRQQWQTELDTLMKRMK